MTVVFFCVTCSLSFAQEGDQPPGKITLAMRDVELAEVMDMLSRRHRLNILLASGVDASVSFNLYDVEVEEAVRSIATAAGFAVERRGDTLFVLQPEDAGKNADGGFTTVRTFRVEYANPAIVERTLLPYLSSYGTLKAMPESKMLIVQDQPAFVARIARLLKELDHGPRQILIEAKILEITLTDEDSYGMDWSGFFNSQDGTGTVGTQGLSGPGTSGSKGFFFDYMTSDHDILLNALESRGRVRALATPKLLALENEEASVIVGDRTGYLVTTTINQVTTETVEFLESGVILRVTPAIDDQGRVMLDVHPQVSTSTVDANGIPSLTTTEVNTLLLVPSGQSVFIGGLIRQSSVESRKSVPVLGRIPVLGHLFSSKEKTNISTETIVLITPRIVNSTSTGFDAEQVRKVHEVEQRFADKTAATERDVEKYLIDQFVQEAPSSPANPHETPN